MDELEELLPEDDSVFLALVDESLDMSGGALLEDSFSSIPEVACSNAPEVTSTPFGKGNCQNAAQSADASGIGPVCPQSPSQSTRLRSAAATAAATATASTDAAPVRSAILQRQRAATPTNDGSPARSTRSKRAATPPTDASPARSTRSRRAATPPTDSSPARSTRSRRAGTSTTEASPARSTRSRRAATPTNASPARPTCRRAATSTQTSCNLPQRPSSPAMGTRSRARPSTPTPSTSQSRVTLDPSAAPRPRTGSPARRRPSSPGVRARPAANVSSGASQTARIKCRECPNTYANEGTFQVHKKWHAMKRAFSRIAKPEDFLEKLPNLIMNALNKILEEKYIGKWAEGVKKLTSDIKSTFSVLEEDHDFLFKFLHEHLYTMLADHTSVFPSSVATTYHVGVNSLLNSLDFKNDLKKHLVALGEVATPPMEVINIFIGNFMLFLSSEVIVHFIRTIHGATSNDEIRRKRSADQIDSKTFLQLIYHIGGSVLSGLLFKGNKRKDESEKWSAFVNILHDKFLSVEGSSNQCAPEVSEYTRSIDRGKMKHPTQEALDFFIVLFDLLMSLEGKDGSLPPDAIDNFVLKDDTILILWDILVGNALDNETSLSFLIKTSETCKLIVMKGIILRLLNENIKKPLSAVPLRSRLAN